MRRRRARSEANRRLQTALKLLDAGEAVEFHAEIHRALTSFIADRLNLPVASLTNASQLSEELLERGMDDQTVRRLAEVVERCEFGRFAAPPPRTGCFSAVSPGKISIQRNGKKSLKT